MLLYIVVIVIYLSFLMDFMVWPIPSEASTYSIINNNLQISFIHKFFILLVFTMNLMFYLTPLVLSVYYLVNGSIHPVMILAIFGIIISIIGRLISIKAAQKLRNNSIGLVCDSLFKYSRNPISLGMHITIIGLMIIFGKWYLWLGFIFYLINIDFKIRIEESHLMKRYGAYYNSYQKKTPRYLIKIGW